jgi:hypothetical protein
MTDPPRILFIIARPQERLHEYVSYRLGSEPEIEVVRDRRRDERRRGARPVPLERRGLQRRLHDVSRPLATLGYAIVRRPVAAPPTE